MELQFLLTYAWLLHAHDQVWMMLRLQQSANDTAATGQANMHNSHGSAGL